MTSIDLWNLTAEQNALATEWLAENTPAWMTSIDANDIAAICQGGCASGAYMPAVTYYLANATMAEQGNEVLEFIEEALGELPTPPNGLSWNEIASFYLVYAVELFTMQAEGVLTELLEDAEEEADEAEEGEL